MYRAVFPLLKMLDPEVAHYAGMAVLRAVQQPVTRDILHAITKPHSSLRTTVMGIDFPSPFGVAAGFDKKYNNICQLWLITPNHHARGTKRENQSRHQKKKCDRVSLK